MRRIILPRLVVGQAVRAAQIDHMVKEMSETFGGGLDGSSLHPNLKFSVGLAGSQFVVPSAWREGRSHAYLSFPKDAFSRIIPRAMELVAVLVAGSGLQRFAAPVDVWDRMVLVRVDSETVATLGPVPEVEATRYGLPQHTPTPGVSEARSVVGVLTPGSAVPIAAGQVLQLTAGHPSWQLQLTAVLAAPHTAD